MWTHMRRSCPFWIQMWIHMSRIISFCFQMRRIVPSGSRCGSTWVAYPGNLLMVTDVDPCDVQHLLLVFFSCWIHKWIALPLPGSWCGSPWGTFSFWIQMWIYMSPSSLPDSGWGSLWRAIPVYKSNPLARFRCGSPYLFLVPDVDLHESRSSGFLLGIHVRCIICCWRFSPRWIQMCESTWSPNRIISSWIQILVLHESHCPPWIQMSIRIELKNKRVTHCPHTNTINKLFYFQK
jgi:hypothetical protein